MENEVDRSRIEIEIAALNRRLDELHDELAHADGPSGDLDDLGDEVTTVLASAMRSEPPPTGPSESTVVEGPRGKSPRPVSTQATSLRPPPPGPEAESEFERRYLAGELLGEGGMGEVRVYTDRRIGRDVAGKVLRPDAARVPNLRERFLFEARVQGQLEHPAIVPVYDLGVRPDGSEYFTMRRLVGWTLHQVLKDLRRGDRATANQFSRRRLLAAFQSVCLAAEFAHQRGVIHRDLKPANVMLGAYGEVSVLDWGVAKLSRQEPPVTPTPAAAAALEEAHTQTQVGEILGTPGYMSPEQAAGSPDVGPESDLFSLGAMLYEILTLHKLVPGHSDRDVRENTLRGRYDAAISNRFPQLDIPKQLEDLCVRATQHDGALRLSARELHDELDRYLEGEGDVRRRRSLSRRHTRAAIAALALASDQPGSDLAKDARSRAIREAQRALALDPDNQTAVRTLVRLMTAVPTTPSPQAEAAVAEQAARARSLSASRGAVAYLGVALTIGSSALLGVHSWPVLATAVGLLLASSGLAFWASRQERPNPLLAIPIVVLSSSAFAATSALFGAFALAPTLCAINAVCIAVAMDARIRRHAVAWGIAAIALPAFAQWSGIVPAAWRFTGGVIEITPNVVAFPETATTLFLAIASVGAVVVPALLVGAERDARAAAERALTLQAHQLAEFLPPDLSMAAARPDSGAAPSERAGRLLDTTDSLGTSSRASSPGDDTQA